MKKIATWLFATLGGIVLLFSYKTSTEAVPPAVAPLGDPTSVAAESRSGATTDSGAQPAAPPDAASGTAPGDSGSAVPTLQAPELADQAAVATGFKDGTYTGARQRTRYGPVQVTITVAGGQITDATATDYPNGSREDKAINSYAIPVLQSEAVGTTDGQIDMVSGATYTSRGFIGSLQDAINQARA